MNQESSNPGRYRPLRVWIPVLLLLAMGVARFIPEMIDDGPANIWMIAAFGPGLLSLLLIVWWVAVSRARWSERLIGAVGITVTSVAVFMLVDHSMQGPASIVMTFPMGVAAFALTLVACSRMLSMKRTWFALFAMMIACGFSATLKSDGMWGDGALGLNWRWVLTPEEQFLAQKTETTGILVEESAELTAALLQPEWPGFRGPNRDGVQHGTVIDSDWEKNSPEELWRIQVGPGWSSFAVAGPLIFTQEQRREFETIVCYESATGQEVWAQSIESRFFEALGGLGPRATPTISNGRVYAMGAEGWLSCMDARTGDLFWKTDLRVAASVDPPDWGFSSSPCVTNGVVIVHAGGEGDKGIMAFDENNGELAWSCAAGKLSYCSPQIVNLVDRRLVALLTNEGLHLLDPTNGAKALDYEWPFTGYRVLQPQTIDGNGILIPTGMGKGTRLLRLSESDNILTANEAWTSPSMKPDYNDLVVHQGYLYGFDNQIFACVDLNDGSRKWKKGRYGKGQVLLLADSDLLVIVSETGQLVLLKATPDGHQELARIDALDGKTWNHPVVVGDRLFIRNAKEAVCYRLPSQPTR